MANPNSNHQGGKMLPNPESKRSRAKIARSLEPHRLSASARAFGAYCDEHADEMDDEFERRVMGYDLADEL